MASSDESTASHTEYPTGPYEQKNSPSGSLVSAEKALGAPINNNASINADDVFDSEPTAINADDATLQKSRVSLRRRKAPSDIYEEPFCSDCELVIRVDHLLRCSEPSCTEKVCFIMYNVVRV